MIVQRYVNINGAPDTITKWMKDGMTREEAIYKWECITRATLPDRIKGMIPVEVY